MRKIKWLLILFLSGIIPGLSAQDIYFCSNVGNNGEPVGASKNWELDTNGGYIYILFSNHKKHIKSKNLIAQILKKSGLIYHKYEKRAIEMQGDNTWAALDYQFVESGNYKVDVQDLSGKVLATNYVTINIKTSRQILDSGIGKYKESINDPERNYYHAKTIFCKSVMNESPVDSGTVFPAGEVNVFVINDQPMASDSLIVDIFKKGFETEKYPIYISTKNISINRTLNKASFTLNFDQTGQYKIVSYNGRSQTISTGYITIR